MTKLIHKTPCKECPWRMDSLQGYLGGNTAETYADAVAGNAIPPCHMNEEALCAGACSVAANACILPYDASEKEAVRAVGKREDTFWTPAVFYAYHTGKHYTPFIIRKLSERN